MSQAHKQVDDIPVLLACATTDAELQDGFKLIEQHLRDPVCGWVRQSRYPGISPEDLADLWQETLMELLQQVRAGKYTGERKVFTDLCQIISANAIDARRRKNSREKVLCAVGEILRGTQAGQRWKDTDPVLRRELEGLIRAGALTFSLKQRQVLEARTANFPESIDMQALRKFASELAGEEVTLASVKGSMREIRKKLRAMLKRKGYAPTPEGEDDE